ncbi:MAG: hypothetical protein SWC40_05625 [Thermodesulfobacteriota bacterium]|nr:hypothetical protein [Thermodesulfobacteriota bacterium]
MKHDTMRLRILLPTEILLEEPVRKIVAEAPNGFFCLLPRHVDFVTALVLGILSYEAEDGRERFAAMDEGISRRWTGTYAFPAETPWPGWNWSAWNGPWPIDSGSGAIRNERPVPA